MGLVLFSLLGTFPVPVFRCDRCWKVYREARAWADASQEAHPEMAEELDRKIPRNCPDCSGRRRVRLFHLLFALASVSGQIQSANG